jgi:hypothetical protein
LVGLVGWFESLPRAVLVARGRMQASCRPRISAAADGVPPQETPPPRGRRKQQLGIQKPVSTQICRPAASRAGGALWNHSRTMSFLAARCRAADSAGQDAGSASSFGDRFTRTHLARFPGRNCAGGGSLFRIGWLAYPCVRGAHGWISGDGDQIRSRSFQEVGFNIGWRSLPRAQAFQHGHERSNSHADT